jgi:hypothetical protein
MCKAFSCLFLKSGRVLWKFAVDSHEELISENNISDDGRKQDFVRVEITPKNGSYLRPDEWVFRVDQNETPEWFGKDYAKKMCFTAHGDWLKKLRTVLPEQDLINPLLIPLPKKITSKHVNTLKKWASVGASVRASVWDSVRASVGASVRASVGASVGDSVLDSVWDSVRASVGASVGDSVLDSVWASVGASVRASVWAYTGSLFALARKDWKYTDKIKTKGYPFQPCVDLWKIGLVPSFDGKTWRINGGKDAKVLWEGEL